ncbi:Acetyltransferase (GNAT) family protein [Vibrio crassostreae]|uniref:GNAT family N-acetyltransferase n=1 Tax=Vibrio crassostreae TaxID=246167 RepID=UPI001B3183D5|nr:GNAT family N-acetyltransferase [Vibrio crassostreae]CAK1834000.1 Acetyltransferase (GNAT) family protein [Vibrio crassostreae]CAK1836335.1 Acetyltransferase (GNAT) family protein [Vibrio crassostreae]CAK1838786.1 Acetyltransferase (GNAT) family protein [Vibrio crassostreae]CAK1843148.1 Acetyltransferase (GNAT) family protein [Vibrio crassostreae]CAK1846875.1 Acetyltransferase (GNAT) family protein [Vibrio crassostreae]
MEIISEIEVSKEQHQAITDLRNSAFPDHQVERSYYKQLPHMRALEYREGRLAGYLGLDYRMISVGDSAYKVRGQGVGTSMLSELDEYAKNRDVDFIILISDLHDFYSSQGYVQTPSTNSWLRLHEHLSYGVAVEEINDLYVKSLNGKQWCLGDVDWLGYMY